MPDTSSMALRAGNLLHQNDAPTGIGRDAFTEMMMEADLPFIALEIPADTGSCDIVVFTDGSGFFADDIDAPGWTPWVLDCFDKQGWEGEILPPSADARTQVDFKEPYRFLSNDIVDRDAFDALLTACARAHSDPPEGLRPYLVEPHCDFQWRCDGTDIATRKLCQIALVLCPTAVDLTIHGECVEGRSPVQRERDANTQAMLREIGSNLGKDATMAAHNSGLPYAEITDSGSDYETAHRANQVLTPISQEILARRGNPVGWETDYNDGPRNRMSGYSAYGQSEVFELAALSAHSRLSAVASIVAFMREEGLGDRFDRLLAEHGFAPIG